MGVQLPCSVAIWPSHQTLQSGNLGRRGYLLAQALVDPPSSMDILTAACAVEEACVIIDVGSSLDSALAALSGSEQATGVVLGDNGAVIGVVTRESILRAMRAGSEADSSAESVDK